MQPRSQPTKDSPVAPSGPWHLSRQAWKRLITVTLIVVAIGIYNLRERKAWEAVRNTLEAKGEPITLSAALPRDIPDAENFAAHPLWDALFLAGDRWRETPIAQIRHDWGAEGKQPEGRFPRWNLGDWKTGRRPDLSRLAEGYRLHAELFQLQKEGLEKKSDAEVILQALALHDPALQEIESCLDRPGARFNARYLPPMEPLQPHLFCLEKLAIIQSIQAMAHLHEGNDRAAFQRLHAGLRLQETLAEEPVFLSQDSRAYMLGGMMNVLWEGWCRSAWNLEELEMLASLLAQVNFVEAWKRCWRLERARWIALDPSPFLMTLMADPEPVGLRHRWVHLLPSGFWNRNRRNLCTDLERILPLLYQESSRSFVLGHPSPPSVLEKTLRHEPEQLLSSHAWAKLEIQTERMAIYQATAGLAHVAIQVALHHRKTGAWPESIEEVLPGEPGLEWIDPFSGTPYRYRPPREPGDTPELYSIGRDYRDDGGRIQRSRRGASSTNGDRVWSRTPRMMEETPNPEQTL